MTVNYFGRIYAHPPLYEMLRKKLPPNGLLVEGALTPRLAVKMTGKIGVDAVILKTGVAIDANVNINAPINGQLKVDISNRIYHAKINTPSQDRKLVVLQTKPYTFRSEGDVNISSIGNVGNEVKKSIKGQLIKRKPLIVRNRFDI
ncbi:uncharacterized protein LOC117111414 [Anneissia japonica]|uniref:uncharacterized protein LOC117111414 n=1 Tax=Anneissia japonica TaxID=1529436 RepID=UPI001425B91D|nr:uncharacterized protein LOC117111414 [Anneissia japonica]